MTCSALFFTITKLSRQSDSAEVTALLHATGCLEDHSKFLLARLLLRLCVNTFPTKHLERPGLADSFTTNWTDQQGTGERGLAQKANMELSEANNGRFFADGNMRCFVVVLVKSCTKHHVLPAAAQHHNLPIHKASDRTGS